MAVAPTPAERQALTVLAILADPHMLKLIAHLARVTRVETPFAVYDMEEEAKANERSRN